MKKNIKVKVLFVLLIISTIVLVFFLGTSTKSRLSEQNDFKRKQECQGYIQQYQEKINAKAQQKLTLGGDVQEVFYSSKMNTCFVYTSEALAVSNEGLITTSLNLYDALTSKNIISRGFTIPLSSPSFDNEIMLFEEKVNSYK